MPTVLQVGLYSFIFIKAGIYLGILITINLSNSSQKPMDYHDIITIEPGKRSGKPCIRGMRITVYDILEYLAGGMTEAEVLEDFSELTSEDIKACLAFAADREKKLFVAFE
jgi:uncharacterized protein (DUF433 family)